MKPLTLGPLILRVPSSKFAAPALIAFGVGIRFVLVASGWPHTTIDEGTIGEMAMNIAYHGEHPIFFYGQYYMGSLQAYIAAGLFHLFGVSLFTLRLALVLLFAFFLIGMYLLARLLYTRKIALLSVFLLSLGTNLVMYRETQAIGGYPETLVFGSLALLFASWLAIARVNAPQSRWRPLVYGSWGLVVGLGIWSDQLILPCVLLSGLLLLCFCWRDVFTWALPCIVPGLLLGAMPLILYNLTAKPGYDSLTVLLKIYQEGHQSPLLLLPRSVPSALLVSLPTITSYPQTCDVAATRFLAAAGQSSLRCALLQGGWSFGIVLLWLVSLVLTMSMIGRVVFRVPMQTRTLEQRLALARAGGQAALLLAVALSFVLFAISPTAAFSPSLNARYLICVLLGTPALLAPLLWRGYVARSDGRDKSRLYNAYALYLKGVQGAVLLFIIALFLLGTVRTLQDIPNAQASDQDHANFVQHLLDAGITHVYSEMWTCDLIVFQSQQRLACSVVNEQLHPTGDRDSRNTLLVQADPLASYAFPIGSSYANVASARFASAGKPYKRYVFDGYVVFQPVAR